MRRKTFNISNSEGYYTIEGALSITIFIVLFLMILSIMQIVLLELKIQRTLNTTAMKISQSAYLVDNLEGLSRKFSESKMSQSMLCEMQFLKEFNVNNPNEWLSKRGVKSGVLGLNFLESNIDFNNNEVNVIVNYYLDLNTFNLFEKGILIKQCAATSLWSEKGDNNLVKKSYSIWDLKPIERGKKFVELSKNQLGGQAVASGQGIDLYYKEENAIAEVHSLNIFDASYSDNGVANFDNLNKQIYEYATEMLIDTNESKRLLDMEDGSRVNFSRNVEKRLIIIMPQEAQENENFNYALNEIGNSIDNDMDIKVVVKFWEEAFPSDK